MKYPYFRGLEADRYSFYRVPKALIKVDLFEKMSGDAKLLYAVLLDRMNLSLKNGWQDENGNAYIICTIDEIMDSIRCARQKAVKLLDELEHEYQLIERRRQGLGKPNLLYVKDLYAGLSQSNYWKYENHTSGGMKNELPGVPKSNGSNTEKINKTDNKKILWYSGMIAFIFSINIEMLQLFLRLGTFQLSDLFYNTVGGALGGLMYYAAMKARKHQ